MATENEFDKIRKFVAEKPTHYTITSESSAKRVMDSLLPKVGGGIATSALVFAVGLGTLALTGGLAGPVIAAVAAGSAVLGSATVATYTGVTYGKISQKHFKKVGVESTISEVISNEESAYKYIQELESKPNTTEFTIDGKKMSRKALQRLIKEHEKCAYSGLKYLLNQGLQYSDTINALNKSKQARALKEYEQQDLKENINSMDSICKCVYQLASKREKFNPYKDLIVDYMRDGCLLGYGNKKDDYNRQIGSLKNLTKNEAFKLYSSMYEFEALKELEAIRERDFEVQNEINANYNNRLEVYKLLATFETDFGKLTAEQQELALELQEYQKHVNLLGVAQRTADGMTDELSQERNQLNSAIHELQTLLLQSNKDKKKIDDAYNQLSDMVNNVLAGINEVTKYNAVVEEKKDVQQRLSQTEKEKDELQTKLGQEQAKNATLGEISLAVLSDLKTSAENAISMLPSKLIESNQKLKIAVDKLNELGTLDTESLTTIRVKEYFSALQFVVKVLNVNLKLTVNTLKQSNKGQVNRVNELNNTLETIKATLQAEKDKNAQLNSELTVSRQKVKDVEHERNIAEDERDIARDMLYEDNQIASSSTGQLVGYLTQSEKQRKEIKEELTQEKEKSARITEGIVKVLNNRAKEVVKQFSLKYLESKPKTRANIEKLKEFSSSQTPKTDEEIEQYKELLGKIENVLKLKTLSEQSKLLADRNKEKTQNKALNEQLKIVEQERDTAEDERDIARDVAYETEQERRAITSKAEQYKDAVTRLESELTTSGQQLKRALDDNNYWKQATTELQRKHKKASNIARTAIAKGNQERQGRITAEDERDFARDVAYETEQEKRTISSSAGQLAEQNQDEIATLQSQLTASDQQLKRVLADGNYWRETSADLQRKHKKASNIARTTIAKGNQERRGRITAEDERDFARDVAYETEQEKRTISSSAGQLAEHLKQSDSQNATLRSNNKRLAQVNKQIREETERTKSIHQAELAKKDAEIADLTQINNGYVQSIGENIDRIIGLEEDNRKLQGDNDNLRRQVEDSMIDTRKAIGTAEAEAYHRGITDGRASRDDEFKQLGEELDDTKRDLAVYEHTRIYLRDKGRLEAKMANLVDKMQGYIELTVEKAPQGYNKADIQNVGYYIDSVMGILTSSMNSEGSLTADELENKYKTAKKLFESAYYNVLSEADKDAIKEKAKGVKTFKHLKDSVKESSNRF